ncbi:MAG: response regulator transcription factor [Selenomonadaceae bacterium]|nr:response regulator transcription factor [Selenomonadaceae bacterium]MBQ6132496.1 response regulator transcription factor [Selenomonadaceae bacterium]MBQ7493038.1 response regulator transcription factor [Selenomonadaceae bacterium]
MAEKIFIVEDERPIARLLQLTLEREGFKTANETNGRRAYERILQEKYDLVLLDVMLPEMDGMEICKRVREVSDVPIIMVTARDEVRDKVEGLDLGADDYMTKPFAPEELLARIRGVLRRHNERLRNAEESRYVVKNMILYPERYEVTVKGEKVELTHKEYALLKYLVENKRNVLSRDQILQTVWGYDYIGDTNVVDVYISYLRSKIDDKFGEKYIYTTRGVGYAIRD